MTPQEAINLLVQALAAGAAAGLTTTVPRAVKDAYQVLKDLLVVEVRDEAVAAAVSELDKQPKPGRKVVLQEVLEESVGVHGPERVTNERLLGAAKHLLEMLQREGIPAGSNVLIGSGGQAIGPGATASGQGGISIGSIGKVPDAAPEK